MKNKKEKKQNRFFILLQKLGKSFMLPIAVLPVAGLLLGIGSSFTNAVTLANLGLSETLGPGSVGYSIFSIMSGVGSAIFDNLPLIFAIGVAIGMVDNQKETAALAAALSYLVMNITINKILIIRGLIDSEGNIISNMADGMITQSLGITTLQVGVFGGIVVGIGVSMLHNRFHGIQLPDFLAFFGGDRFVPIVSVFTYIFVGALFSFIWPSIQNIIVFLGGYVAKGGVVGAFLFDFIKRLLIPFGLHHVFYLPFWQTALGGSAVVGGVEYVGAQNILFAQLADPSTAHISRNVAMYFTGAYPIMIFGLPAACLAMYKNARDENKKAVKSLMFSAAVTSILTGITEPVEFPIIFASPALYFVNSVLYGLSNVILYLLNITIGSTFSNGLTDLILLGVLPGNSKTSWVLLIPVCIGFFLLYYFIFDFSIRTFNIKTPGREEYKTDIKVNAIGANASDLIISGLGGRDNIVTFDCCATRLRVEVKDPRKISESELRNTGSLGIFRKDTAIQVVYGPGVNLVKEKLVKYLQTDNNESILVRTPLVGKYVKLEDVPDEAFASGSVGKGVAVDPENENVYAPADGRVTFITKTKHAIGFRCNNGISLLIHLGIDTVNLEGKGFETLVKEGEAVRLGTPLIKMDLEYLRNNAKSMICPVIVTDLDEDRIVEIVADENIEYNESVMRISINQELS